MIASPTSTRRSTLFQQTHLNLYDPYPLGRASHMQMVSCAFQLAELDTGILI